MSSSPLSLRNGIQALSRLEACSLGGVTNGRRFKLLDQHNMDIKRRARTKHDNADGPSKWVSHDTRRVKKAHMPKRKKGFFLLQDQETLDEAVSK